MPKISVVKRKHIAAPVDTVFRLVADYAHWNRWSPWLLADPDAEVTVSQPSDTEGSSYAWSSEIVGEGRLEHQVVSDGQIIVDRLEFIKPHRSHATTKFEFEERDDGTEITWSMDSQLPIFMFFIRDMMEAMIGMDYERGLVMIKDLAERGELQASTRIFGTQLIGPLQVVGVRRESWFSDIGAEMEDAFKRADEAMSSADIDVTGERIAVYHRMKAKGDVRFTYTAGRICTPSVAPIPTGLATWSMPEMNALRIDHYGPYRHLGNAWSAGNQLTRSRRMKQSKIGAFELYKNNPHDVAESDLLTEVYLPLK